LTTACNTPRPRTRCRPWNIAQLLGVRPPAQRTKADGISQRCARRCHGQDHLPHAQIGGAGPALFTEPKHGAHNLPLMCPSHDPRIEREVLRGSRRRADAPGVLLRALGKVEYLKISLGNPTPLARRDGVLHGHNLSILSQQRRESRLTNLVDTVPSMITIRAILTLHTLGVLDLSVLLTRKMVSKLNPPHHNTTRHKVRRAWPTAELGKIRNYRGHHLCRSGSWTALEQERGRT
jgi:hypothetical protein